MKLSSKLTSLLLVASIVPMLAGCFGAAAVGVGAGALMYSDRRQSETYLADEGIEIRTANRVSEKYGDKVHVNVTSYNRTILLTGEVPDAATRDSIEKIAATVTEARRITNELQIAGNSSFAARSNDTYLTSKVKARFIDASKFAINHVKVITEANTVYLLGLVTQQEADAAIEIARTTGGVQRVVRVFDIITDEQAKILDNRKDDGVKAPVRSEEGKTKK